MYLYLSLFGKKSIKIVKIPDYCTISERAVISILSKNIFIKSHTNLSSSETNDQSLIRLPVILTLDQLIELFSSLILIILNPPMRKQDFFTISSVS